MPSESLASKVYDEVLDRILTGRLAPGDVCNRRQIAAELGVSVAPVLEAMVQLEADGLIEIRARQGTRVRKLTLDDLRGQLILREALECQAARLYCGAPVRRHLDRLLRLAEAIDARDPSSPDHVREEVVFHHSLVSLAEVHALTGAYAKVMRHGFLYAIRVLQPDARRVTRSSHAQLVRALTTDDPDFAEAVARAHAQSGKEFLFDQWAPEEVPAWMRGNVLRARSATSDARV
jgi:GntR family transcriptional regulator, rspAB operon transcriptional repressor